MLSSLGLKPSNVTSLIDTESPQGFKCTHCASSFPTRALRDAHRRAVKKTDVLEKGEVGGLTDISDTEQ
jgi:transposase-like protein